MGQNKISGVYKITNNITGDLYIGSSKDIKRRWAQHRYLSQWKLHPSSKLYLAMAQYGVNNFTFNIIEETDSLKEREQYWISQLKPSYNNYWAKGWNMRRRKESGRKSYIERYIVHRAEYAAKHKKYYNTHPEVLAKHKLYNNRICLYEGKTLTLAALSRRLSRQGIPHSYIEAKNYLIEKEE